MYTFIFLFTRVIDRQKRKCIVIRYVGIIQQSYFR